MKQVDYIIVGCGLAGIAFCEQLLQNQKTFVVFDDQSQLSSIVAAGLYNAVTLKRFTEVWKADEQLSIAIPFYQHLEKKLQVKLDYKFPVYRRFASIEEQNDWFAASDKPALENYLSTQLIKNNNPEVIASFGFGKVLQTGRIDTKTLLKHYKIYLKQIDSYSLETFDHDLLEFMENTCTYKSLDAKHIVFAEGFGIKDNPFFSQLPLNVAKGEVITIKAPTLKIEYILKSSVFVVPEGNDLYSVGATYNWEDKTHTITENAKTELLKNLSQLITCDFEVVDQRAGIRPTVKDRKPLVGTHSIRKNLSILNGLGTRGVMIAPYAAKALYNYIENGIPLDRDIDISRFKSI